MDEKFSATYEADIRGGRPCIAPEKLMRAMLLQMLFSIRSERQLVEQIIDGRTTHHDGYAVSMRARKRIEQCFSWGKTVGRWRTESSSIVPNRPPRSGRTHWMTGMGQFGAVRGPRRLVFQRPDSDRGSTLS
jgi:hypothetical protein